MWCFQEGEGRDAQHIPDSTQLWTEPMADGICAGGCLQFPDTGSFRTASIFFQCPYNYSLGFRLCLSPEPAALSERLTCWIMKSPEELLTVELIAATTKAGRQRFMHNPYAAHLKLIQQQKVQMERTQLLLFWCWQLSEEYQHFLKNNPGFFDWKTFSGTIWTCCNVIKVDKPWFFSAEHIAGFHLSKVHY